MDRKDILESHPLMERVFTNLRPVIEASAGRLKEAAKKTGEIRVKGEQTLLEHQYYDVTVFQGAYALLECIHQLEDTRKFIRRFPTPRTYEKDRITQDRWIEYHYSHYVVTLVSLDDLSFILVNVVFRLGNPERLCKGDLIKNNEWVKASSVNNSLEVLDKIIKRYRPFRNLYLHRGKTPKLHQVFESDLLDYLKVFSFVNQAGYPILDQKLLDLAYKGEVSKILERLDAEIKQAKKALRGLFDSLLPVYERNALVLRKMGGRQST